MKSPNRRSFKKAFGYFLLILFLSSTFVACGSTSSTNPAPDKESVSTPIPLISEKPPVTTPKPTQPVTSQSPSPSTTPEPVVSSPPAAEPDDPTTPQAPLPSATPPVVSTPEPVVSSPPAAEPVKPATPQDPPPPTTPPAVSTPAPIVSPPPVTEPAEPVGTIVYVTKTGEKYHANGCRYLSKSKIEITLDKAKSRGFDPCSVCKPPQ